jgi:hypothetical protein
VIQGYFIVQLTLDFAVLCYKIIKKTHIPLRITGEKRLRKTRNEELRNLYSPNNIISLAGIVGSNPAGGMDVSRVSVVCFQVEVSVSGWSLLPSVVCLSVIVNPRH